MVDSELNQHYEDMLTEEFSASDTCTLCLKEPSYALACKKCWQKIHIFCDHAGKDDEMDVLCTLFFKVKNAIEGKINSNINLEIQAK